MLRGYHLVVLVTRAKRPIWARSGRLPRRRCMGTFMKLGTLQGLLARGSRHANDLSCLAAHDVQRFDDALPPGLELEWLGTAGFRLGYQGTQILIDPYLTR